AQRINREWDKSHTNAAKTAQQELGNLQRNYAANLNRLYTTQNFDSNALQIPVTNKDVWGTATDPRTKQVTGYFQKYDDKGNILKPTDSAGKYRTISVPDYNTLQEQRTRLRQIGSGDSGNQPDPTAVQTQAAPDFRGQASSILQQNGKPLTEANIQHVMGQ